MLKPSPAVDILLLKVDKVQTNFENKLNCLNKIALPLQEKI